MEVGGGGGYGVEEEGCRTPERSYNEHDQMVCPPAPRKKAAYYNNGKKQRGPPKNGYFQPPDLELLFAMGPPPRREACA